MLIVVVIIIMLIVWCWICPLWFQARKQNEEIKEAQEAKKKEAERKRKEMEETELRRKLDEELAAKKAAAAGSPGAVSNWRNQTFCVTGMPS